MNKFVRLLGVIAAVSVLSASAMSAATVIGKVTFVGTVNEEKIGDGYGARFRVAVNGTCDNFTSPQTRWLLIRSGRVDGIFAHNGVNTRNAYSTLLSALQSGNTVQIDNLPSCSSTAAISVDLWNSQVGVSQGATQIDSGTALHPVN